MERMATRVVAKAMLAGVAACAGAGGVAQAPARPDPRGPVIAQAGVSPAFRANQPVRLTPTGDGPTSEAPLSFGRRQPPVPGTASSAPAAATASPGVATSPAAATASPGVATSPAPAAASPAAAPVRSPQVEATAGSGSRAQATPASGPQLAATPASAPRAEGDAPTTSPQAETSQSKPQSGPKPTSARPVAAPAPAHASHVGAKREEEARALARLRARLEETLARHSKVDARVKAQRNALHVVSHGPEEPPRKLAVSATSTPGAARSASAARRPAQTAPKRPAGSAEFRDWSYRGETGPEHWARLNPAWAACDADVPQSPIDIRDGIAVGLPPIEFDLPPAQLTIRDDGRAIRAVVREGPGIVTLGRRFELREITFHQPAEFRVEGKAYDLSAHLVHRDDQGRAAIVVVLFEIGDESTPRNPVVQTVLDYLPLTRDMLMPVPERKELGPLLPADSGYYNFVGALSSPPCTEGVIWMVMREPVRIPPSQVAIFARVHPMNVRPLQPLAGRLIKQSE